MATTKVNTEFIAVNAISGTIIADNAITATHIATNAISGTLVQNGGIVTTMIAANNITSTKIVTDAVQTRHIADDQVTEAKLANAINTSIAAKLPLAGGTMTGTIAGFTSTGIDDNADATAITIDSSEKVFVNGGVNITTTAGNTNLQVLTTNSQGANLGGSIGMGGVYNATNQITFAEIHGKKTNSTAANVHGYMAFVTRGDNIAERMRIDSTGNVGIGDTNPSAKLDVNSGTTDTMAHFHSTDDNGFIELKDDDTTGYIGVQNDYLYIGGAPSTNTQNLVINDGTGNVGIGTTSPSAPLDVVTNSTVYTAEFTQSNTSNGDGVLVQVGSTASADYALTVRSDAGNTSVLAAKADGKVGIGTFSPSHMLHVNAADGASDNTQVMTIENNEATDGRSYGLKIKAGSTANDAPLFIQDHDAANDFMIVRGNGAVGIGTTAPAKGKLQIDGGSSGSGDFDALAIKHVNTTTTNDGPVMRFEGSYNSNDWALAEVKAVNGGAGHGADFQIKTHPGTGTQSSATVPTFSLDKTAGGIVRQRLNAQTFTLAANAQKTFTDYINTTGMVNIASQRNGSNSIIYTGGLFYLVYSSSVITEIADVNDLFLTSDTSSGAGKICIYKGNAAATFYIVNRTSHTMTLSVHIVEFQGN